MKKVVVTTRIVHSSVKSIKLTKMRFVNKHAATTPFLLRGENLVVAAVASAAIWATLAWLIAKG